MTRLGFWLVLLVPGFLNAQHTLDTSAQQKFISGGTIRLHLEAGGYTVTPGDSEHIVVTCVARTEEQLKRVKVEIKPTAASADVYVSETPHNNFQATIEVPRHSNLWARLSAGELDIESVEGERPLGCQLPGRESWKPKGAAARLRLQKIGEAGKGSSQCICFPASMRGQVKRCEQPRPKTRFQKFIASPFIATSPRIEPTG
jgi:hypothetical protein